MHRLARFFCATGLIALAAALAAVTKNGDGRQTGSSVQVQYATDLRVHRASEANAESMIHFRVADFSFVDLSVTDLAGNRVRTLVSEHLAGGSYEILWYGETDLAAPLPGGIYLVVLETEDERIIAKAFKARSSAGLPDFTE